MTGDLTMAASDVIIDGGDLRLGSGQRVILDEDGSSFLGKTADNKISVITEGANRFQFVNDSKVSALSTRRIVGRDFGIFSDAKLKNVISTISGGSVLDQIPNNNLNGIVYTCNAQGANDLQDKIGGGGGGGGGRAKCNHHGH